jgi:hypothetical protein
MREIELRNRAALEAYYRKWDLGATFEDAWPKARRLRFDLSLGRRRLRARQFLAQLRCRQAIESARKVTYLQEYLAARYAARPR